MVKIISKPKIAWTRRWTCEECKAELEASSSDLKYHKEQSDGPVHHTPAHYTVECPICHTDLYIEENKIPNYIKRL